MTTSAAIPEHDPSTENSLNTWKYSMSNTMKVMSYELHPPDLNDVAPVLQKVLEKNYETVSVSVVNCPDLRNEPFHLAAKGLSGNECIADIGGQPNLYPEPILSAQYSLLSLAEQMHLRSSGGMLIGAGAGPFFDIGSNSELAPNLSWETQGEAVEPKVLNLTYCTKVTDGGTISCARSPTTNCALMMNVFGSEGRTGPVIKVNVRKSLNGKSLTECMRSGLQDHYGSDKPLSLGGVFVMKKGTAKFHVMPDFPTADKMPFQSRKQLNDWLTYHNFQAPMVCLTVMHTGDPTEASGGNLALRREHTHCFSSSKSDQGGHYHHDIKGEGVEEVEHEGYFNVAKVLHRIDQPDTTLDTDLHDE